MHRSKDTTLQMDQTDWLPQRSSIGSSVAEYGWQMYLVFLLIYEQEKKRAGIVQLEDFKRKF